MLQFKWNWTTWIILCCCFAFYKQKEDYQEVNRLLSRPWREHYSITRAQISTLCLGHLIEKGPTRQNYYSILDIIFPRIGIHNREAVVYNNARALKELIGQMAALGDESGTCNCNCKCKCKKKCRDKKGRKKKKCLKKCKKKC